jgi:hypothetical protein
LVNVSPEARLFPSAHATVRAIDAGGVVVDMRTGRCWELNSVGFAIWQLIVDGRSVTEAAYEIATRYAVEIGVASHDVLAFVQSMVVAGLLEAESSGARRTAP